MTVANPTYTKLTYLQSESLANWLRENYQQRGLTDSASVERANAEIDGLPEINYAHVRHLRGELGIPKNYARKPAAQEPKSAVERLAELEDRVARLTERMAALAERGFE